MASGKTYLTGQKYFKPNYYEALKYIIPEFLTEDDIETFGTDVDIRDQVLNSNIQLASDFSSVITVSAVEGTAFSSIDTLNGITPYFVKQNGLTNLTTSRFEDKILKPLGKSITDFDTSSQLQSYISDDLLPSIVLNNPTATFVAGHSASDTHNYLIENLSWMYFLNTSGVTQQPSSLVIDELTKKFFIGDSIQTNDGVKRLMEFIWKDGQTNYYPSSLFASSVGTYTSGTQQLETLQTWIDVIYSPLHTDSSDFTVRDRFETYIESNLLYQDKIPSGPFTRFLRALSFFAYDINNDTERLSTIFDIDECPDEYLPLLAELIGWDLFGPDPERWRLQLRNAVSIYKAVGTKKSLQYAINSILPKDQFNIETKVTEFYESYVPFLLYYSLATESEYFKSFSTWTPPLASEMQVSGYSTSSLTDNLKYAVDRIMLEVYDRFEASFGPIPNQEKGFYYRGRNYPIPPFEEYSYYANFELTKEVIDFIEDRLVCFGCPKSYASKVNNYITTNALDNDDEARTSSFLLFTSGYNDPPNLDSMVASSYNEKFEYVSLWSGKSSHYKVVYDASSFDFTNTSLDSSTTGGSFIVASRLAQEFSPAHAIPLISLDISYIDPMTGFEVSSLPLIMPNKVEVDPRPARNYQVSGLTLNSYMRDVRTGGSELSRSDTESLVTSRILEAGTASDLERTSVRRRSFEKVMPFNGYYDRTGFNMPTTFQMTEELSGISLGFVPSGYQYTPVTDHVNLPNVWKQCEGLTSRNSYYEYSVSNTLASRGGKVGPTKNLIIFAGQSNFNGRGSGSRDTVTGVKYWDLDTSSFTNLVPGVNTSVNGKAGGGDHPTYKSDSFWGPEVKFAELLKDYGATDNNYLFKFCQDNSWSIDTQASNVGPLSADTEATVIGTRLNSQNAATWCPSSTRDFKLYDKFASSLDNAIDALGGSASINNVYFMWNQGETEAGRGQDSNSIANQYREFTELFLDTIKTKFDSRRFKFLRVKVNNNFAAGSEADWQYFPNGMFSDASSFLPSPNDALGLFGDTSNAGSYGNWSWSSTPTVSDAQVAMSESAYGSLLNLDDLTPSSDDEPLAGTVAVEDAYASSYVNEVLGPLASATLYYEYKNYIHDNIHYLDASLDTMGERLFNSWASETGLLKDPNQRDVRNDRGQLPDIYAVMHSIKEDVKLLEASSTFGPVDLYTQSVSNVYQSYANSATEYNGAFPNTTNDYYNFSFGRDLHRLYTIYTSEFERHQMNERLQTTDGVNVFSHTFGPTLYNHDFEDLSKDISMSSILVSSLSSVVSLTPNSDQFSGSLSYVASSPTDMYLDTFEKVLSGVVSSVEFVHTSGSVNTNSFSIFNINNSFKTTTDDPYLFDNTLILSRATTGGLPRVRFDISKYSSPTDHPIATNFLLPDHYHKLKIRTLISDNAGLNFGGRRVGAWIHTKPESGQMWSYDREGKWSQHSALITRADVLNSYGHVFLLPVKTKKEIETEIIRYECIDVVPEGGGSSPVSKLRKEDFEELTLNFNTRNRDILLPKDYRVNHSLLHRKNQEYVVEVFLVPNGDDEKFMILDTVEIQNMTLKKLSEIFVNGRYQDPLCITPEVIGNCPEYRVELSKDDIRRIFRFFNDIAGKNSKMGLASRDKNETATIMGAEGGSRLDYRYIIEWLDHLPTVAGVPSAGFNQIIITV